jgi:hypothetical protein
MSIIYVCTGTAVDQDAYKDQPLSESHLCQLAQAIGHGWSLLGPELGVPMARIHQFQAENQSVSLQIFHMLRFWKTKSERRPTLKDFQKVVESHPHVYVSWEVIESISHCSDQGTDETVSSRVVTEEDICKIAPVLGDNWQLVGPQLGVTWSVVSSFRQRYAQNIPMQITQMLREWRNINPTKASFSQLLRVLRNSPGVDADLDIIKDLMESTDSQDSTGEYTARPAGEYKYLDVLAFITHRSYRDDLGDLGHCWIDHYRL